MLDLKELARIVAERIKAAVGEVAEQVAAQKATIGEHALLIENIRERGIQHGNDGADGKDGRDGRDGPTMEEVEVLVRSVVAALPAPQKGDRGEPGQGIKGDRGEPGESIKGEKGEPGETIKGDPGRDGADGLNGKDGRDALHLEILPAIESGKTYPRNTYALHLSGLWRAFESTQGMKGWECVVAGVAEVSVEQDEADPRKLTVRSALSTGESIEKTFSLPVMIYRGIYVDADFVRGDVVTWGGSNWHCEEPTRDKPGTSKAWRLMLKRGADGKDGQKGEKGEPGHPGKDLLR